MAFSNTALNWLALWLIPGLGPRKLKYLIDQLGSIEKILSASLDELISIKGINRDLAYLISTAANSSLLKEELASLDKYGLNLIDFDSPRYPSLLKETYTPPAILYSRGYCDLNSGICLGIVGSRKASHYGKTLTAKLIKELALIYPELIIVSGLALGIDTVAHQTALDSGLRTAAVVAGGLSSIYPPQNRDLARSIIERGVLISEYPIKSKPVAANFPRRNRIISGVSKGVLVSEAGEKSGALITANFALEQNRELFALPGPADINFYLGTNRLIQKGYAKLIISAQDILEELIPRVENSNQINFLSQSEIFPRELTAQEEKIIQLLKNGEKTTEELAQMLDLAIGTLLGILTCLELDGLIINKAGSIYQINF